MPCIICKSKKEIKKFRYLSTDFFECAGCGLIRTLPFPSESQIEKHYKDKFKAGNYNTLLSNMEAYIDVYKKYIELLKKRLGTIEKKRILDVGCFTGDFLDLVQREGAITYGIELQKDAFDIATKKHPGRILNCSFDCATFNHGFDIITLFGVLEHLTHPEMLLKMTSDWLAPGCTIIIQTPNTGSIFAKLLHQYWPPYAPIEHIHYFSKKNIKKFLEENDLTNIEIRPHVKSLSIKYVYNMLQSFGREFHQLFSPLFKIMPDSIKSQKMIFYIGEMLVLAEKKL